MVWTKLAPRTIPLPAPRTPPCPPLVLKVRVLTPILTSPLSTRENERVLPARVLRAQTENRTPWRTQNAILRGAADALGVGCLGGWLFLEREDQYPEEEGCRHGD